MLPPQAGKAEMVFENGGRIVSMKADGSERTILTRADAPLGEMSDDGDSEPSISPDGSSLLFSRYLEDSPTGDSSSIVIADREGGPLKTLLPSEQYPSPVRSDVFGPVWSHDSSRVFFIRFGQGGNKFISEVRSIKADGTGMRLISRTSTRLNFGEDEDGYELKPIPIEIAPSPNGDQLLVTYFRFFGASPMNTYLMDPATGKRRLLMKDASGNAWSPDGLRIAFASERDHIDKECYESRCSYDAQLYVMKANGSGVRRLIPGTPQGSAYGPSWAANGNRIAFTSDRGDPRRFSSSEIFSIRPDGRCLARLTNGSPPSGSPAWGPEGSLSAAPGTCGDAAPRALGEITPDPDTLALKLSPFWLGSFFGNTLLSDIFKNGRIVEMEYRDCGALNAANCSRPISVISGPVCEKLSDSAFDDATFTRLVERRGALVMLTEPSGGGIEVIAYSGGVETAIYTRSKFRGRKVKSSVLLRLVDQMRPVTSTDSVTTFEPPVFTLSEVQKARAVLRSWKQLGTLAAAAEKQDMFPKLAGVYLKFGKALARRGKVLTAKCHRRTAVPGSIKLR
ncbi:MAG: PD40 domain-containing protein [Thermoleophilia bacterium]|nr:PD40 domain-containing protein [Thermoleophilia bacterium]